VRCYRPMNEGTSLATVAPGELVLTDVTPATMFSPLSMPEVVLISAKRWGDPRGYFCETYVKSRFAAAGITADFVQDNESVTCGPGRPATAAGPR
jgi:hypothetical protein